MPADMQGVDDFGGTARWRRDMAGDEAPEGRKPSRPRARWLAAGCLCLVPLGAAGTYTAVFLIDHLDHSATERYARSLDAGAAAAVPPGSDQKTAESWLASQGMRVSEWGRTSATPA
jgi:hypothetical protein